MRKTFLVWIGILTFAPGCVPTPPQHLVDLNVRMNREIRYVPDKDEVLDHCKPIALTMMYGGDCDDIVCAKSEALLRLGYPLSDLAMVGGFTKPDGTPHVVLKVQNKWYLDNRHDRVTKQPIDFMERL